MATLPRHMFGLIAGVALLTGCADSDVDAATARSASVRVESFPLRIVPFNLASLAITLYAPPASKPVTEITSGSKGSISLETIF